MNHLDLFSGIGGFALAVDRVWPGSTHIFCDNDLFCQEVLKKHWPDSKIYGDIRTITTDSILTTVRKEYGLSGDERRPASKTGREGLQHSYREAQTVVTEQGNDFKFDLLTGGFPCQPFSQAGRRRGTEDDRYLWPEMLRVIQLTKPAWVIGENVGGFVTWSEGMVLEQVCLDLENEGYEVQPFIIPAVSVNAPHRRDRVWIVAHSKSGDDRGKLRNLPSEDETKFQPQKLHQDETRKLSDAGGNDAHTTSKRLEERTGTSVSGQRCNTTNANTGNPGLQRNGELEAEGYNGQSNREGGYERSDWNQNWIEVATRLCRVDDGVSRRVDRLKALGNAIVPQVAEEIMKAIKSLE